MQLPTVTKINLWTKQEEKKIPLFFSSMTHTKIIQGKGNDKSPKKRQGGCQNIKLLKYCCRQHPQVKLSGSFYKTQRSRDSCRSKASISLQVQGLCLLDFSPLFYSISVVQCILLVLYSENTALTAEAQILDAFNSRCWFSLTRRFPQTLTSHFCHALESTH